MADASLTREEIDRCREWPTGVHEHRARLVATIDERDALLREVLALPRVGLRKQQTDSHASSYSIEVPAGLVERLERAAGADTTGERGPDEGGGT